jgi:plasmid stability protein
MEVIGMPTLTIKNIPDDLYAQLKRHAEMNRRSLNSEVIVCIEKAVRGRRVSPEVALARARKLRAKTGQYPINDQGFTQAKMMGRP